MAGKVTSLEFAAHRFVHKPVQIDARSRFVAVRQKITNTLPSQSVNITPPKSQLEGNYVTVKLGEKRDTGAVMSLINESTTTDLRLCVKPITEPNDRPLVSATDSEIKLLGHAIVQLYFKGLKIKQRLGVVEELTPNFLLGVDFLTTNVAAVDYTVSPPVLRLFDDFIQIPLFNRCDETNCVILDCTAVIPAYNEAYLPVKSPVQYNNQDVLLEQPSRIWGRPAMEVTFCTKSTSTQNCYHL